VDEGLDEGEHAVAGLDNHAYRGLLCEVVDDMKRLEHEHAEEIGAFERRAAPEESSDSEDS
jgi:hypothetical protein